MLDIAGRLFRQPIFLLIFPSSCGHSLLPYFSRHNRALVKISNMRHNRKRTRTRKDRSCRLIIAKDCNLKPIEPISTALYSSAIWGPQNESQRSALRLKNLAFYPAFDEFSAVHDIGPIHSSVFGADAGDEAGDLCGPMLQVLLDLNLFA